jgi:lipoprotein-anchoring transpeptidase ErfK/SrfK
MLRLLKGAAAGAASILLLAATPAYSADRDEASTAMVSVTLAPGQFVWEASAPTTGPVEIVVSLPLQVAYVYRAGALIGVSTISSGAPGHETPTGSFAILQKRRDHRSNLYNNAPMPFMQRLTWDGIALHAGEIPGRPASHGCVRLPLAFARELFTMTRLGGSVHIVDSAPTPEQAVALLRDQPAATALASN